MSMQTIRSRLATWAGACAVATALLAPAGSQAAYVLSEFSIAGAAGTALWDVNNAGAMVGYSLDGAGTASAFVRASDGTVTSLTGPAGAVSSVATGISDSGTVVGSFVASSGGGQQGFLYTGGSYMLFNIAGATHTFLRGISPDGRFIAGYYDAGTTSVAFVHDTSTHITHMVPELAGSGTTIGQGVTNAGVLVGSDFISGTGMGFLYDIPTSTRTDVTLAGATRTALRAIDDSGVLAGWFIDAGGTHGFIGSTSNYETIDFVGATSTVVEGSNNARWLVGTWYDAAGAQHAFYATPVSAPGSLPLLALGLAALGASAARRRSA